MIVRFCGKKEASGAPLAARLLINEACIKHGGVRDFVFFAWGVI